MSSRTGRVLVSLAMLMTLFAADSGRLSAESGNTCVDDLVLDTVYTTDRGEKKAVMIYQGVTYRVVSGQNVPPVSPVFQVVSIADTGVTILLASGKQCLMGLESPSLPSLGL